MPCRLVRSQNDGSYKELQPHNLHSDDASDGATQEQTGVTTSHPDAPHTSGSSTSAGSHTLPDAITFLASVWGKLPPHIREAIVTLASSVGEAGQVDAGDDL